VSKSSRQTVAERVRGLSPVGDYFAGAGFALGVVGALLLLLTPILYYLVPLVLGLVALPLAWLGMVRARRAGHPGFWLGVAGVAVAAVAVVLGVVYALVFHEALAGFGT
jgi:hypothetical protein